jgi:hypothetical protein
MVNVMPMVILTDHAFDLHQDVWVILILILIWILNVIFDFDPVVNYQMVVVVLYQKSTSTTQRETNKNKESNKISKYFEWR